MVRQWLGVIDEVATRIGWLPALLSRVTLGVVFIQSGWGKLHNLPQVTEFFASLGIPAPQLQAPFVSVVELVGGAMILAGFLTRVAAIPLAVTMIVAIATAKLNEIARPTDLFVISEFLYIVLLLWLATAGPGWLSCDRILNRRRT